MRYWFTSDYHIGHKNVLWLCKRQFSSIKEMEDAIVRNHNSVVAKDDMVYNLGDFAYKCSPEYVADFISEINGKIVLLLGNHDKPIRNAYRLGYLGKLISSGKLTIVGNIEDPTESVIKRIEINGQVIHLSHPALRTWYGAFRGSWHLYGHSHSNLKSLYKSMDVGVDSNNFFPFSFEDVKKNMDSVIEDFKEDRQE